MLNFNKLVEKLIVENNPANNGVQSQTSSSTTDNKPQQNNIPQTKGGALNESMKSFYEKAKIPNSPYNVVLSNIHKIVALGGGQRKRGWISKGKTYFSSGKFLSDLRSGAYNAFKGALKGLLKGAVDVVKGVPGAVKTLADKL